MHHDLSHHVYAPWRVRVVTYKELYAIPRIEISTESRRASPHTNDTHLQLTPGVINCPTPDIKVTSGLRDMDQGGANYQPPPTELDDAR